MLYIRKNVRLLRFKCEKSRENMVKIQKSRNHRPTIGAKIVKNSQKSKNQTKTDQKLVK